MAIKLRRGLESQRTTFIPDDGEIIYTTDTRKIYVGDGLTPGGNENGGTTAAELLKTEVHNATGSTLTAGQVVYLSGNTGNKPNAVLAKADAESTSSKTIGLIIANIANNANGYIATDGLLDDLNTSMFVAGDMLWLSDSIAGGVTTIIPDTPSHAVFIGYVTYAHPTNGEILIHIQNGYELNELHDVKITSVANGDGLIYDTALGYWKNSDTVTTQGNTFNAANKLVQLDATAKLPAVDGSQLTNLPSFSPPNGLLKLASAISTTFQAVTDYLGNASVLFLNSRRIGIGKDTSVTTQSVAVVEVQDTNTSIVLKPNGTGAIIASVPDGTATGGNARGNNSVDLQQTRQFALEVASGLQSGILSGFGNRATNSYAIVGGGFQNRSTGLYSSVLGGQYNQSNSFYAMVGGGNNNISSGDGSTISGGASNTASSNYSTISGGQSNTASTNTHATVVGGQSNTASGQYSIAGGNNNTVSGQYNIGLGNTNNTSGIGAYALGSSNTVSGNGSTENSFTIGESNNISSSRGNYSFGRANAINNGKYQQTIGQSNTISSTNRDNSIFGTSNNISGTSLRGYTIGYSNTITGGTLNFAIGYNNYMGSGNYNKALSDSCEWLAGDYTTSIGTSPNPYLRNQFVHGAFGGSPVRGRSQVSNLISYNDGVLTTGATVVLSLDGTGTTNLIIPYGNNRAWNVQIDTIAVVTAITGTATGVSVGDCYRETKQLLFKRIGGTSSIVGSVDTNAIKSDTSMSTATITISAGASQQMAITFTAPTFAGGGSVTCRVVSKVSLVEVAY